MTDLTTERFEYGTDDRRWLRDHTGFAGTLGLTLDGSLFSASRFPDGVVPSGTVLAKVTASGLWGPYDPAATDGRQTATPKASRVMFLLEARTVRPGRRITTAGLDHGRINTTYLPKPPTGVTGAAAAVGVLDDAARAAMACDYMTGENV